MEFDRKRVKVERKKKRSRDLKRRGADIAALYSGKKY